MLIDIAAAVVLLTATFSFAEYATAGVAMITSFDLYLKSSRTVDFIPLRQLHWINNSMVETAAGIEVATKDH